MTEGFSHVPRAKSIEEETRIAVHPESNEGKRFLRDTGEFCFLKLHCKYNWVNH